ncbi:ATP-binding cassette sub- A member 1 [Desmophyllum pertusum]|uniref:ATP-binding cassette sub- A member 1 n=1 Tax=Desmophyllum pertusum TaxID=174260 RepID=A0A9W9ZRX0_9CNID|nr:ATP-binding cassette sub- A member 1 [Desmophyllum pertusum]
MGSSLDEGVGMDSLDASEQDSLQLCANETLPRTPLCGHGSVLQSLQDLFEELDKNLDKLHVGSYGVSDTTLEEVFLKLQKRRTQKKKIKNWKKCHRHLIAPMEVTTQTEKLEGAKLLKGQFWALLVKRFHHARRNRKEFLSQLTKPAIHFTDPVTRYFRVPGHDRVSDQTISEMPALELNTNMFLDVDPHEHYLAFAVDNGDRSVATQDMTDMLVEYPGVGTSCLEKSCKRKPIMFSSPPTEPVSTLQCDCQSTGTAKCPAGAGGPKPSQWDSFTGDKLQNLTGRNMTDYLLKTYGRFIRKRYGGVTFGDNFKNMPKSFTQTNLTSIQGILKEHNAKAWYNTKGYHAAPTFLNILNNVILRSKAAEKGLNASQFGITTINHPMNYTKEQLTDETFYNRVVDVLVAICVVFALSGVRPYVYWLSTYVWDLGNYIIPAVCCCLIFLAFGEDAYTSAMNFPPTFLLLLLYGWAITPLMYPASFLFSESSTAYIVLICVNLFIGINTTLATFILELFADDKELVAINDFLKKLFLIFPNYCLGRGLIDLAKNQFMDVFERFGQNLVRDPFSWDITGRNILMMIIQGFVFFFITILIEYRFFLPQRRVQVALKPV